MLSSKHPSLVQVTVDISILICEGGYVFAIPFFTLTNKDNIISPVFNQSFMLKKEANVTMGLQIKGVCLIR